MVKKSLVKATKNTTVTPIEATQTAVKMHRQRISYDKIADHLKALGYISERTGKPIKEMAVRYMVTQFLKEEKDGIAEDKAEEQKAATEEKRMLVVTNEPTLKEQIKAISAMAGFSDEFKMRLIEAVASGDKQVVLDTNDFKKVIKSKVAEMQAQASSSTK